MKTDIKNKDYATAELILNKNMSIEEVSNNFKQTFGLSLRFYPHLSISDMTVVGGYKDENEDFTDSDSLLIRAHEKVGNVEKRISSFYKIPVHITSLSNMCLLDANLKLGLAWRW